MNMGTAILAAILAAGPTTRVVEVRDLDVRDGADLETLFARLHSAAEGVCGSDSAKGFAERHRARRCVADTLDGAVADARLHRLEIRHRLQQR